MGFRPIPHYHITADQTDDRWTYTLEGAARRRLTQLAKEGFDPHITRCIDLPCGPTTGLEYDDSKEYHATQATG